MKTTDCREKKERKCRKKGRMMMETTDKRRSERWNLTPLTFLTVFCKAGDGRRDKSRRRRKSEQT